MSTRAREGGGDRVEALLRRVRAWLGSDGPEPSPHPEAEAFAAYIDWLADGAPGECPVPEVREHAAACRECYLKAEDLLLAHLECEREMAQSLLGSFLITLAREPGASYLAFRDEWGSPARLPLGMSGDLAAMAGAVAERGPAYGPSWDDRASAGGPTLHFAYARLTVDVRPTPGGLDLVVTARHRGTGEGLPDHAVRLLNDAGETLRETATDREGTAAFYALPPQAYQVEICS